MSEYITGHENADQDTDCIMFSNAFYTTLDLCRHTKKKHRLITPDRIIDVEWDKCPDQRQLDHRTYFVVTPSHMARHFANLKWKRDFWNEDNFPQDDGISDSGSDGEDFGPDVTSSGSDSDSDCEEEEAVEI